MKPKVVEEEKWIEIDGSVKQQWLLAVYFLTFDEERIHSNVTMISIMSLCKYLQKRGLIASINFTPEKLEVYALWNGLYNTSKISIFLEMWKPTFFQKYGKFGSAFVILSRRILCFDFC